MAPMRDISTTSLPRWLLALTMALIAVRVVLLCFGHYGTNKPQSVSQLQWTEVADTSQIAAAKKNRWVLYKFCASWSEPCRRLDSEVFLNHNVADLARSSFFTVKVTDKLKENGSNSALVSELEKRYHIFV